MAADGDFNTEKGRQGLAEALTHKKHQRHDPYPGSEYMRLLPKSMSYDRQTQTQLEDWMEKTASAAEYISCYRRIHYPTLYAAAYTLATDKTKKPNTMPFRDWEGGHTLPDYASLVQLRKEFFKRPEHATAFEKLVADNRRIFMAETLHTGEKKRFGQLLRRMHPHSTFLELNNFLKLRLADTATAQSATRDSALIINRLVRPSIFLHFMRHALDISKDIVYSETGLAPAIILNIEAEYGKDRSNISENRVAYFRCLESKFADYIKNLTSEERASEQYAPAMEFAALLSDDKTHAWVDVWVSAARKAEVHWRGAAGKDKTVRG